MHPFYAESVCHKSLSLVGVVNLNGWASWRRDAAYRSAIFARWSALSLLHESQHLAGLSLQTHDINSLKHYNDESKSELYSELWGNYAMEK